MDKATVIVPASNLHMIVSLNEIQSNIINGGDEEVPDLPEMGEVIEYSRVLNNTRIKIKQVQSTAEQYYKFSCYFQ